MTGGAPVLLVGEDAEGMAARLELSGHRPLQDDGTLATAPDPQAVIVAPDQEHRISALRRRFGDVPLLLGIREDTVAGRMRCLASGADDYWLPSVGASDLLTRLRLHLALDQRRMPPPAPLGEVLELADLVVSPGSRQVRRGDRRVELTSREYEVLLLLLRHANSVVARDRILAEVWQGETAAASNVVDVYVRYLRQKLEQGGERRLIHTVRGQGYRLAQAP
jgi:two-component system response regulator MprA